MPSHHRDALSVTPATFRHDFDGNGRPPLILDAIEQHLASRESIRMLDAGCGDHRRVRPDIPTYAVGIDESREQIARNADIDEAIVGDLATAPIEQDSHDVAVCWNVLEHLPEPFLVIDRLIASLAPGGLLVLAWPNMASVKAILARRLPYAVHVALFRWLYPNSPTEDDHGPFPTVLHKGLTVDRVVAHVKQRGLALETLLSYETEMQQNTRRRTHLTGWRWRVARRSISWLSGRRVDPERSDVVALFAKPRLD